MSYYTSNSNTYTNCPPKQVRIYFGSSQSNAKESIQDNYLNEESQNTNFFPQYIDAETRSKSSSYLNTDYESRSSMLASSTYEFDQVIEDNQSNFLELEDLSRGSSELLQQNMNNYYSNSHISEYASNEHDYNENNRYFEAHEEKSANMMATIAEQFHKEQENSFNYDHGRKDYDQYFSNEHFEQANSNFELENYPSNLECNQQYNNNLKNTCRNQNDGDQYAPQQSLQSYQYCEQKCYDLKSQQNYHQQPSFNMEFPSNLVFNRNQYEGQINHTDLKNQDNENNDVNLQGASQTQFGLSQSNEKQNFMNEVKSSENINQQKDSVISEFQSIVQNEVEGSFNYYQYYKTFQQEQGSNSLLVEENNQPQSVSLQNISSYTNQTQNGSSSGEQTSYRSIQIKNNGKRELTLIIPFIPKDTDKSEISKSDQKEKKKMEKNDLAKIEDLEEEAEDLIDEDETVGSQTKEGKQSSKKLSIDIHTSTSAVLLNDEEPVVPLQKEEEETLQKIEEMKVCNKKNVVKNIMNAYKNFILEAELKNTPKVNQNIVNLYNNNKTDESDSLQEIIKKFKRYINSKNFNHYSMRLLILHPNYGPVLQYFLKGPIFEWAKTCKANDLASHFVMVDFLLLSFSDIKFIDELKRHEKKKAHYQ